MPKEEVFNAEQKNGEVPIKLLMSCSLVFLTLVVAGSAQADTSVDFDGLAFGSQLTNQYAPLGVTFGSGPPGLSACNLVGIGGTAPYMSSPPNAAYAGGGGGEFALGRICMRFSALASHVSVQAGTSGVGPFSQVVSLVGYDTSGHPLTGGGATTKSMPANGLAGKEHHLEISARAPRIRWAVVQFGPSDGSALSGGNYVPAIDDLSFDSSISAPPSFTMSATHASRIIRQGSTASILLSILRFGNPPSTGDINLSVLGLPSGVTATFSSNPISGSAASKQVTVALHAAPDAPVIDATKPVPVTITATPTSPSVGPAAVTVGASVAVQSALVLRIGHTAATSAGSTPIIKIPGKDPNGNQNYLFPCRSINVPVFLSVPISDSPPPQGPVTLSISIPPQMEWVAPILDKTVLAPGLEPLPETFATLMVTTNAYALNDNQPLEFQVHASQAPGVSRTITLHMNRSHAAIQELRPSGTVMAPERLELGSTLEIWGHGFCPGSVVQFGNSLATATSIALSKGNPEIMTVQTPRLATSGGLEVRDPAGGVADWNSIFVNDERSYSGFAFKNYDLDTIDWDVVVALYGEDHTMLNPCSSFTLGLIDCDTPIPDPLAWHYWLLAIKDQAEHGVCFGWTMSTQRLYRLEASAADFPPNNPLAHQWELNSPDPVGPSSELSFYIQQQHVSQFSAEAIRHFITNEGGFDTLAQLRATYRDRLQNHYPDLPLIDMRNALFKGHTVAVYDAVDTPGGGLDLFVINPNVPFTTLENAFDGKAHSKAVMTNSRIVFDADGNWTFPQLGWSGGIYDVKYWDADTIPVQPTLPFDLSGALVFATGAAIEQVSDASGHRLFRTDGTLETSPSERLPGATIIPTESSPTIVLQNTDPVTLLAQPRGNSNWQAGFVGKGMVGRVQIGGPSSGTPITLDPRGGIGAHAAAGTNVHLHLAFRPQDGSRRSITCTGRSSGGSDRLALDGNQTIQVIHDGPSTTGSLTLEWIGRRNDGKLFASNFHNDAFAVQENSSLTINPTSWSSLASGITITTRRADGAIRLLDVPQSAPTKLIEIESVQAVRRGRTASALTVLSSGNALPEGASATVTWIVRRDNRLVARHSESVLQRAGAPFRLARTWLFKTITSGRYQLDAIVYIRLPDGRASVAKRSIQFKIG